MIELDYSEIHHSRRIRGTKQTESMEDKRLGEILTMGLHKNTKGNWEAPLPFKSDDLSLPDNKGHCLRSFLSLNRPLLNESKLEKDYLGFMTKRIDNDHASQVPVDQLSKEKGKVLHLPHFHIIIPRKKTESDRSRVCLRCHLQERVAKQAPTPRSRSVKFPDRSADTIEKRRSCFYL